MLYCLLYFIHTALQLNFVVVLISLFFAIFAPGYFTYLQRDDNFFVIECVDDDIFSMILFDIALLPSDFVDGGVYVLKEEERLVDDIDE